MTRSSEEIEREVEQTRAGLDGTIEALKSKMSPGQIIDELTQSLKGGSGGEVLANLGAQVKENPLAVAMIGAGITWLMMGKAAPGASAATGTAASAAHSSDPLGGNEAAAGFAQGGSGSGKFQDKAADLADSAASKVGDAIGQVKHGAADLAAQAQHGAQSLGEGAANAAGKVQDGFMAALDREPLVIGALGLAVGVAIGAALPSTPLEDRTFGAARDKLLDEAKSRVGEGVDQAKDVAAAAYRGVGDAAKDQGLVGDAGGSVADKAETVLKAGVDAARSSFEDARQSPHGGA